MPLGVLGRLLITLGLGYTLIGYGWIVAAIGQRIAGVEWMQIIAGYHIIGIGWVVVGVASVTTGLLSRRSRAAETAGMLTATAWPLLISGLFMIAWWTGEHSTGWITASIYAILSAVVFTVATAPPALVIIERQVEGDE